MSKFDTRKDKGDDGKYLGVLYTGYLDKRNPVSGSFKKRFVVLTHDALHWFKRAEGYDLFGEERGHVVLANVLSTRILDEDSTAFEVQGTDNNRRLFRATAPAICEEWVSAIRSAIKASNSKRPTAQRRGSLAGIRNAVEDSDTEHESSEVTVLLVSVFSALRQHELVVARNPEYSRMITVAAFKPDDRIIISTSNGGSVVLTYEAICMRAEEDVEFDVAVQNVPLASSLRLALSMASVREKNVKQTMQKQISDVILLISRDRSLAISMVLSLMVILTGLRSLANLTPNLLLLFLFAAALAVYNIFQALEICWERQEQKQRSSTLRLSVMGHAFTSPDAPVVDTDNDIPQRFIDGCNGDLKEARQRWDVTRHWREAEGVNHILEEPQPFFYVIKNMYPHYHAGRGKQGHIIYWERPGEFEAAQLAARGIKIEHLVRHWLFNTEYQWQVMCGGDEAAKSIYVLDMNGIRLGDLGGDIVSFVKKTVGIANQHYPERSHVIYIVNAPFYFAMMWKMVKPLVHENTQKKIRILSAKETLSGLQEHIDITCIPAYYGGQMDFGGDAVDSCRINSPEAVALNEFVTRLNEGGAAGTRIPFGDGQDLPASGALPPGNPGDVDSGRIASAPGTPRRASMGPRRPLPTHTRSQSDGTDHADDWSIASATTAPATPVSTHTPFTSPGLTVNTGPSRTLHTQPAPGPSGRR